MANVHLIGNAHLDPVWLWRWQEGHSEVMATFRSALDRIRDFDEFVFTCAGAVYYQWIEQTDPEMFEEIRRAVKAGKWVIVGGWMIQPDCNLPCGESFARHSLYGQTYFREKFGVTAKVGYNVDSFGHSAMLPQILKHGGLTGYMFRRPDETEMTYPFPDHTFLWTSPDGTTVPAFRMPKGYGSGPFGQAADKARAVLDISDSLGGKPLMCMYGVGNHGGGPTIDNILALKDAQAGPRGEEFVFSSPNRFFEELDTTGLPEHHGDLFHHASGCYSLSMQTKTLNRISEAHLVNAEKASLLARFAGVSQDTDSLKEAWQPTLFNHFHDIICGCSVKSALKDAEYAFGSSIYGADTVANKALQRIAWNIDTSRGLPLRKESTWGLWETDNAGSPVVLFNMNAFPVKVPVKLGVLVSSVTDDQGNDVPMQQVRAEKTERTNLWESEIVAELPPMGWRLYWCYNKKLPPYAFTPNPRMTDRHMENEFLSIDFAADGRLEKIYDKKNGRQMLSRAVTPLVIDESHCDAWAHKITKFDRVIGQFTNGRLVYARQNRLRQEIRMAYSYGNSTLEIEYMLYKGLPELRMVCTLNWQEKHRMLKLAFPTAMRNGHDVTSVPFGFTHRKADGTENPMQKWLCVEDVGYGFGLATDTRSAYDLKDGELRITVARGALIADHYGARDGIGSYTDQGEQVFQLAVLPVTNGYEDLYRLSETLLTAPSVVLGTYHAGKLGATGSAMVISAANIGVTAFKPAEDGRGYILRCHELSGKATETAIRIPALGVDAVCSFNPQQIRSFRILDGKLTETDFMEDPI